MIRDGFKDEKKVTSRENRKKIALGERNFYAKEITKLRDLNKSLSFSNHFMLVVLLLAYAFVLLLFFLTKDSEEPFSPVQFIIWSAVMGAFLVWYIVWFVAIKPTNEKKAERYKKELERISRASVDKVGGAYKIYGSDYIEKLRKQNAELKPKTSEDTENTSTGNPEEKSEKGEETQENRE